MASALDEPAQANSLVDAADADAVLSQRVAYNHAPVVAAPRDDDIGRTAVAAAGDGPSRIMQDVGQSMGPDRERIGAARTM